MSVFDGLSDIFVSTFGQAVAIRPLAGGSITATMQGVYQSRSVDAFGVTQPEAMLHLKSSDAALLVDGVIVGVGGFWFIPRVQEPDGKGMVPIRLEKMTHPPE